MICKVCGIRSRDDVRILNSVRPDMAGFVFHRPSRRYVDPGDALELRGLMDRSIASVGVFVDDDPRFIADLVGNETISVVQLHGSEDAMYIHGLRALTHAPIVKAFVVEGDDDIREANLSPADLVMLDAGKGSGRRFDWSLADGMRRDYILSGGLDPTNLQEALERVRPFGVDVSSGVETDGRKDPSKVSEFLGVVRSFDRRTSF